MKVLFLPNWKVIHTDSNRCKQSPDIYLNGERYWFFKHWPVEDLQVTIIDCGDTVGKFEKKIFKFHVAQAIKAFLVAQHYDLIVSHGSQSVLLLALLMKISLRKKPPILLIDVSSINGGKTGQPILAISRFASTRIDKLVYHAKFQTEHYKNHFPHILKKSLFVPFGVDTSFFTGPTSVKERDYILSFGYRSRDWETMVKGYEKSGIRTRLIIIGPNNINVSIPDNVILHPAVPVTSLKCLIKNSKFIIIPLTNKQYAHGQMSILQSMALGKPIITANIGAICDYIVHGKDALLYELGNQASLAEQIIAMNDNYQLRKRIGLQAALAIKNKYNEKIMGKLLWEAAKSVVSHQG